MPSSYRPLALVCTAGAAALLLGACSAAVTESDLEERVAGALFTGFGAFPAVSCDGDLAAEVDATTTCNAFFSDTLQSLTVDLTVTSVDGATVNFDIEPRS